MKRIHYAGGTLVTGDDLADAVLIYAQALANSGKADAVTVPILLPDDSVVDATMLLGPASQLVGFTERTQHEDIVDEDLLKDIRQRIGRRMDGAIPMSAEELGRSGYDSFDED